MSSFLLVDSSYEYVLVRILSTFMLFGAFTSFPITKVMTRIIAVFLLFILFREWIHSPEPIHLFVTTASQSMKENRRSNFSDLLSARGSSVNVQDINGEAPLLIATRGEIPEMVETLLFFGADVNLQNHQGVTPLMEASSKGHKVMVESLLDKGAIVNMKCNAGKTSLMHASSNGHDEVVALLTRDDNADINAKDNLGMTALLHASVRNHLTTSLALIWRGALVDEGVFTEFGTAPIPKSLWQRQHAKPVPISDKEKRECVHALKWANFVKICSDL